MKQDLFPKSSNKLDRLLTNNRKSRFLSGLCCLHCQSTAVKRNEEMLLKFYTNLLESSASINAATSTVCVICINKCTISSSNKKARTLI